MTRLPGRRRGAAAPGRDRPAPRSDARTAAERGKRRLTLALAATVVVAVLLAGGAWAWLREQRRARVERTAAGRQPAIGKARVAAGKPTPRRLTDLGGWRRPRPCAARPWPRRAGRAALDAGEADEATRRELDALLPRLRTRPGRHPQPGTCSNGCTTSASLANDALNDDDFDRYLAEARQRGPLRLQRRQPAPPTTRGRSAITASTSSGLGPEQAADAIRREALRPELADALDDWFRLTEAGAAARETAPHRRTRSMPRPVPRERPASLGPARLPALAQLAAAEQAVALPVSDVAVARPTACSRATRSSAGIELTAAGAGGPAGRLLAEQQARRVPHVLPAARRRRRALGRPPASSRPRWSSGRRARPPASTWPKP